MGPYTQAVLDTNIFISALLNDGPARQVLAACIIGSVTLITSEAQLSELERVWRQPTLRISDESRAQTRTFIAEQAVIVETTGTLHIVTADPTDDVILETAIMGRAQFLITGDAHLLALDGYHGTRILTPTAFLARLAVQESAQGRQHS